MDGASCTLSYLLLLYPPLSYLGGVLSGRAVFVILSALSYLLLLFLLLLWCPLLSYLILSYLILSYLILSYLILATHIFQARSPQPTPHRRQLTFFVYIFFSTGRRQLFVCLHLGSPSQRQLTSADWWIG